MIASARRNTWERKGSEDEFRRTLTRLESERAVSCVVGLETPGTGMREVLFGTELWWTSEHSKCQRKVPGVDPVISQSVC